MAILWCNEVLPRSANAAECPKCGGFAREMENLTDEIYAEAAPRDCGRRMCCVSAFECKKCGSVVLAELESPEFS